MSNSKTLLIINGLHSNVEVLIDQEDLEKVKHLSWWITRKDNEYMTIYTQINRKTIVLARLLMGFPKGLMIDHINGDTLDNRKGNLRQATPRQNAQNSKKKASNTSGFSGVDFRKDRKKWRVTIRINGVKKSLGHYESFEDACTVRSEAIGTHYREFARK